MALMYDWYETPGSHDTPDEEKLLYPRVCLHHRCTTDSLCKEIEKMTTAHSADIRLVLSALSDTLKRRLKDGYQVHLDGLGYFNVTLGVREPVRRSTKDKWRKVKINGIKFLPEKELKDEILWSELAPLEVRHSQQLADAEIDRRLAAHFASQPYLTRSEFQSLCGLTRTTACRLLSRLVTDGLLQKKGTTTQPFYVPAPGHYGVPAATEEEPATGQESHENEQDTQK